MAHCNCNCNCNCSPAPCGTRENPVDCFWFNQGKCTIDKLPPGMVYQIMSTTPQARIDLLRCTCDTCEIDPGWVDYAETTEGSVDEWVVSDRFQKTSNRFIDRHRLIQNSTVFRTPKGYENTDTGLEKKDE